MQRFCRLDCVGGVVGEQWRNFERNPAVNAAARIKYRAKQVGGARQVVECQFEEDPFVGLA